MMSRHPETTPKLVPHPEIKDMYIAYLPGLGAGRTYIGEISRLKSRQFLVRDAARRNLSDVCGSLQEAVAQLAASL